MTRLFKGLALLVLAAVLAVPALAQDAPELIPFADSTFGIQGVVPDGWTNMGSGLYARGNTASDPTLLAVQAASVPTDILWSSLLPQLGLEEIPDSVGSYAAAAFDWTLYQIDVETPMGAIRVDLALAEAEGKTCLVLLQTAPSDYDALHESVFVPVLDAYTLLEVTPQPVPYQVEEVTFPNGDITLAGTLTLPDTPGPHPAIALMTGSGPQTRDEDVIGGYPIFKLIADYLTRQGIAVLRYDDRGIGRSTGGYAAATLYDFASDGQAAVAYLHTRDDINAEQIGVLGHSEGGTYAAMLGADPDSGIAFIVSLAGTAVPGRDIILRQNELILRAQGASDELVQSQMDFLNQAFPLIDRRDWDAVEQLVYDTLLEQWNLMSEELQAATGAPDAESYAELLSNQFRQTTAGEWFPTFVEYNPGEDWAQTTVPVLGIYGELDVQVDDEQNAPALQAALAEAGNQDATIVTLDSANHLFQRAETGGMQEYATLPKEFVSNLLPTIADWLLERVDVAA